MAAGYIYEPVIHEQTTPASTWEKAHNFGRKVNVAVYNDSGVQIYPEVREKSGDELNTIQILFYEKSTLTNHTGKLVIS